MGSAAESQLISFSDLEQLREARAIIQSEAEGLVEVSDRLGTEFCVALRTLHDCSGIVVVTGMGKAGLIGQKIAATLTSMGSRSQFLHPAEAFHGDLGCLRTGDVLLALSNSGETEEICSLLPLVRRMQVPIVAVTAIQKSSLGSQADVCISLGRLKEAGPHGLAPSTSTTAMLAVGDAFALILSRMKGWTPQQFAVFHPGGNLGWQLKTVGELMRKASQLRIASEAASIRDVFVSLSKPGRRTGAVMLVDSAGRLSGVFTDSDLARLLELRRDRQLDLPVSESMTRSPLTIRADALLPEVVEILSSKKVSELPVVDENDKPIGLIDITDVIGHLPGDAES